MLRENMKDKRIVTIAIVFLLLLLTASTSFVNAGKRIGGIDFYTAADGGEKTTFNLGETVILKARKVVPGTFRIEYTLIYPHGLQAGPKVYTLTGTGEFMVDMWAIAPNDPTGVYNIRVKVFDAAGCMIDDNYLTFSVTSAVPPPPPPPGPFITPEVLIAIVIVAVAAIVGVVLIISKPKEKGAVPPTIPPTAPPRPPTSAGETVVVREPATVVMTKPTGETITYIAGLKLGERLIPIRSLPQAFGRDDFRGLIPEDALNFISRRHFEIRYDYSRGRFIVEDLGSTNGTLLNGEEIKGKGPRELKDGDVISPAGVVNLRFTVKVT